MSYVWAKVPERSLGKDFRLQLNSPAVELPKFKGW